MIEARDTELAVLLTGVNGSLPGDELIWETDGPPKLKLGPRFGALSEEAGPQPASPARSTKLRSNVERGDDRCRHGCSKCMFTGYSDDVGDGHEEALFRLD